MYKVKKIFGIADAHGIESMKDIQDMSEADIKRRKFTMFLRAEANRQRHAVLYEAEVAGETLKEVERKLDKGFFIGALVQLKREALSVGFPEGRFKMYEKSWKMIPDDDLDPYYVKEEE